MKLGTQEHFFDLAERLFRGLHAGEKLLCSLSAERSDFVRFSQARVRQAGSVEQRALSLRLVRGRRQVGGTLALGGASEDLSSAESLLGRLRPLLDAVPDDPWLLINEAIQSSEREQRGSLPPAEAAAEQILGAARGLDFVGIYAAGVVARGFANSLGQRNWHAVESFNLDFSLYREADQAIKAGYAGFAWDTGLLSDRVAAASEQLGWLGAARRDLAPGEYRVYLAPRALEEVTGLLAWGGFSARGHALRNTPLLRMQSGASLAEQVTLLECTADGLAPGFQAEGFVKPSAVTLIERGQLAQTLVSPRSSREFGLASNAANARESPESLELLPGSLPRADVLRALDTGLYVNNLWYLNFSDRAAGRITGMTRFATLWVEDGRIAGPVPPMRFDDSIYRMLGSELVALTREQELLADPSTYGERSTASSRLPGAVLKALRFTL